MTVDEGLDRLSTPSAMTMTLSANGPKARKIPASREESARLLEAAGVKPPVALPAKDMASSNRPFEKNPE